MPADDAWKISDGQHVMRFDGSTSAAVLSDTGSLTSAMRPISVSFWYRGSTASATRHLIYQNTANVNNPNLAFAVERISDSSHRLGLYSGSFVYSSAFAWDLLPHHYAVSWAANNSVSFYRDGVFLSSSGIVPFSTGGPSWQFNRLGLGLAGFSMTGDLFEFAKYARLLHPNEIRLLASRPGIACEMIPRQVAGSEALIAAYRARQYAQIIGGGVI
jgi:hypothetical protein